MAAGGHRGRVEHFGRGVLEGVEAVLMVIDPSYESVVLAVRAKDLAEEAGKNYLAVLNKIDETNEAILRRELEERGIPIFGAFYFSPQITQANLLGNLVTAKNLVNEVKIIIDRMAGLMNPIIS